MLYTLPMQTTPTTSAQTDVHEAFLSLRAGARACEPDSWWLKQTELTTLGYEAIVAEVADEIRRRFPSGDAVLLDWGAGPAFTTFLFERLGLSCIYYDFNHGFPSYRWVLDQLDSPKLYVGEDSTTLPFKEATFEAVLSCGVLEHVVDQKASIAELYRVLKPGGLLFVYHFPNRYSYTEALAGAIGQSNHEVRWSKRHLLQALSNAGFQAEWFDYRYMIPRNLVDYPRARRFFSDNARGLYAFDRALSKVPGLNVVANSLNCLVRKPTLPQTLGYRTVTYRQPA
jgi:ubiquinone/menaquinone biosynthesis C-methylase UbiE